ncbi:MAG: penicillin binding protein PBP4B, partial [Alkalibacterium sp.]|nr:penicillin binding protein PBP4B [Alkalibacterium sp.]
MNILKITSIVGLSALVLSGCKGAEEEIDGSSNNNSSVKVELVEDTPKNTQLDATFPLETSSDNYSSRILPSVIKSFHHYKNQGTVILSPENVTDFNLFVNGKKVNIDNDEWENESVYQLDISDYTVNGNNSIQISDVKGDEPQVHVQISYPTVIDDDEYYTDNETLDLVDSIIESEMENGFTSAQLTVIKDGKIRKSESYGHVNSYNADGTLIEEDESAEVTEETLFDLASNTKMYATNYAIQKLVSEEEISTEDLVSDYFTDFKDDESDEISGKDVMTIEDLLTHQAGFPADPQYHNNNFTDIEENEDGENALFSQDKSTTKDMILKTPLVYEPGTETRYSDVDYMLLGLIVEQVSGNDLDTYVKKNFYEPLGLDKLTFNPLDNGFEKNEIAATELQGNTRDGVVDFENIRTETIQGEVHDEKAYYAMDGISGHAGLFSNAKNLATLAQVMLNKGGYGDNAFFSEEVVQDFTKASDINDTYGLG